MMKKPSLHCTLVYTVVVFGVCKCKCNTQNAARAPRLAISIREARRPSRQNTQLNITRVLNSYTHSRYTHMRARIR